MTRILLTLGFFLAFSSNTFATHAVGADLTYDCLGGNQYRFKLKIYRDCAGISLGNTTSITISSANCGSSTSLTLTRSSFKEISPLCATSLPLSRCNGGTLPGIQEHLYEGVYTLPQACTDWKFGYTLCCRNNAITTVTSPGSQNLYVEATLNNVAAPCNSSPDFSVNPVPYICSNQPFYYNQGASDVDGDSMVYTLIPSKHTTSTNVPYIAPYSAANPIATASGFNFNSSTGQASFTPTTNQIGIVAVMVSEYRAGVLIGSTIRDMQVIVLNCVNQTPTITDPVNISGAIYNPATRIFTVCAGNTMTFRVTSSDPDAAQTLTMLSNALTSTPGATLTHVGTNPIVSTYTWTPPTNLTGSNFSISFNVSDGFCPILATASIGFNIYVPKVSIKASDTIVCPGNSKNITLNATTIGANGTETYQWGPPVGFVSATNIKNPTVAVNQPIRYWVTMQQFGCTVRDTINIRPYATLVINPDTVNFCIVDSPVTLNAIFTKIDTAYKAPVTYSWTPAAGLIPSATVSNPKVSPTVSTTYTVVAGDSICRLTRTARVNLVPCVCRDTARIAAPNLLTCARLRDTLNATGSRFIASTTFQWIVSGGGNIVSGANTLRPIIDRPGVYKLVLSNTLSGCRDSATVTVLQDISLPIVDTGADTTLTCTRTSLTLRANTAQVGATFVWSTGATTQNITVNTPNTYIVRVTNPITRCVGADTVVVTRDLTWPVVNAGVDTVLNCVRTSLTLQATSNIAGTTFVWSNGTIGANNTISAPNTYTVTATNPATGCTSSDAVVVTRNITAPTAAVSIDSILTCTRTSFNLLASSNVSNATFAWSNGPITALNAVSSPTTYTVTATNPLNGCTVSAARIVTQNITIPTVNAGLDTVLNCVRTSLTLRATSNVSTATFAWSNAINTQNNTVTSPNTYTVTATNPTNGCTVSDEVIVSQNITNPTVNAGLDTVLNCVRTSLVLQANANITNVSYAWSNAVTTQNNSVNSPNTYTVTVTNTYNRCTATDAVIVTRDLTWPVVNAGVDTVLNCVRTSLTLQATSNIAGTTFVWSNGTTGASNNISSPSTYTVTATNPATGCTSSDNVVVIRDIIVPSANAGIDTVLNCVRTSLNLVATSNVANASFAWSNATLTATNNVSSPNTYTVTVTNTYNRCTASDAVVVSQDITTPSANAGIDTVLNCVRTSLNLVANANVANASFAWSNGTNTATNNVSTPNTYTVTVTNTYNGCTAADAVVVTQDITVPTIDAGIDTVLNCVRTSLALQASANRATFAWSNGPITALNTISSPNTYTVTATDTYNGCTATDAVVVTQDITAPTIDAGIDTVLNCVRTSLALQASANRATFAWSNGPITALNTISSPNTYTVTATDTYNGCTATDAVVVTQDITAPTIDAGVDTILNCLITSLSLEASANRATFAWSNGSITALNTISSPNTYTVTATDTYNGCTASDAVVVTQDITAPNVSAGVDTILLCNRTSVQLQAIGVLSNYVWSNGAPTESTIVSSPGTYSVTATNIYNNCTASDEVVVTQDTTAPIVDAGIDTVLNCVRTSLALQASANRATFAWSNGPITALNTISSPNTYTVTATDTYNGCTAVDAVVVTQDITAPTIDAGIDTVLNCVRTSLALQASANRATFAWSNGPITALNTISSPNTYTVTATDTYNGCTATDAVVVTQDITAPTIDAGVDTILNCLITSLSLEASANRATFAWSNGSITALNTISSPNTYTVTATDTYNGCTATDAVVVTQDITAPNVSAGVDTILLCNRTSVQLQAIGVLSNYVWSNGAPTESTIVSSPGTYSVTATNIYNNCTASDEVVVTQDTTAPIVDAGIDTVLNCVRTSLALQASANRATFAWSNGPITALNTISSPNTYTVTATDTYNGCTAVDAVVVTQDITAPTIDAGIDTVLNCVRTSLALQASANRATFAWSNGPITALNTISSPNTYTVTATDTYNGCTAVDAVVVTQDTTAPTIDAGIDTVLNCVRTSLALQASASRATFAWSNGSITALNTISSPNTYTVTATDTYNGCTATDAVVVTQDITTPSANAGIDTVLNCVRTSLNLVATSNVANASFAWSNGTNTATNNVSTPNTYTVTVTNTYNGCTAADAVVVTQDITVPTIDAGIDTVLNCVRTSLALQASANRATFAWSNGPITSLNTISSPNTYTVTATDTYNGCTAADAVVVTQDITAPTIDAGIDTVLNCVRTSLALQASANRATFAWSNGPITALNTISSPNTYTVTATDTYNGCTATDAVVVTQDITAPTIDAGIDTVLNCVRTSLALQASANRATFAWSNGPITSLNTISSPNTYTVTATDTYNGCTAADAVVVMIDTLMPTVDAGSDKIVNCIITSATLTANSTTANVSYNWSNGGNTQSISVSPAIVYTVTATDTHNGCTASDFATVLADTISASINAGNDTLLNCFHPSISLNAATNNSNVSYAWSTGSNTATTMINTGGNYTVTVTLLSNGCSAIDNVSVGYDTVKPIVYAGSDTTLTCRVKTINWSASSNLPNSSFLWNNGVIGAANQSSSPSMFAVIVTNNNNGCTARDTMFVSQNITPPNANAGRDTSLTCVRTQLFLTAGSTTPNVSYNWSTGTSGVMTLITNAGNKTLTVTDNYNGCTASDVVNVRMDTLAPTIDAGPDKIVNCIKTSETFTATAFPPSVFLKWSNDDVTNSIHVSAPIQYSVTATDPGNGCSASDFVTLIADTATPIVNAGPDQELTCNVQTVTFNATVNASPASFIWSNGATQASTQTSDAGIYTVTATNLSNGCIATDKVVAIQIAPPTITYDVRENPCPEVSKGHIVPLVSGGKAPYSFTWNDGSTAPFQLGKKEGTFAVTITDANGCVKTDSFTLTQQYFNIAINGVNEVELGNETTLNVAATGASGLETYLWSPDMFLSCTDCVNPTVAAMNSITYNVVATDTNGCKAKTSHLLTVTPRYDLYVPNAFTPNNDGSNDVYEIFGNKKIWSHLEFSIFNRIGELVFQSSDHEFKWDGTYKGEQMPVGVYIYQMKLSYVNGHVETMQKGSVSLIK